MRRPSTLMTCRSGSTLAPNLRTICPSTSTRPSPISSSQCRLLPTPAAASTFCSRTPSGPSASISVSLSCSSGGRRSSGAMTRILFVLDVLRQERRQLGQLGQAGQAEALEEVVGGPVQDRAGLRIGRLLLHQAAQGERAHHAVAVDAADRGHPGPAHRLPVGDHGERLERGLGQPHLLPVGEEPLHHGSARLPRVEPPAAGDLAQVEAAALRRVGAGERAQFRGHLVPRPLEHLREQQAGHWLVHHQQYRLQAGAQAGQLHGLPRQLRALPARRVVLPGKARIGAVRYHNYPSPSSGGSPVQVTYSSPSGVTCSKDTESSRNSSSSARNLATTSKVPAQSEVRPRKVARPSRWSLPAMISACSRTLVRGEWMCSVDTTGGGLGASVRAAILANSAGPRPSSTSGSRLANRGSSGTRRGNRRAAAAIRPANTAATSL